MVTEVQSLIQKQLPTRKDEDWKYADLSFLRKQDFAPFRWERVNECEYFPAEKRVILRIFDTSSGAEMKYLGGKPPGLEILTAAQFNQTGRAAGVTDFGSYHNYFLNLAAVLKGDNLFVVISKEFPSDGLLEVEMGGGLPPASSPRFYNSHLNIVAEVGASAMLLEKIFLPENYFHLSGLDYFIKRDARLKVLKIEKGETGGRGGHTSRLEILENAEARVTTLTQSSEWSRHNIFAELSGPQANVSLEAAYLARGEDFIDHHSFIDHKVPHTTSSQKYNGVLADKSRGVFNGKVKIDRDAQKSSAVQLNRNLLLSKNAEINTKPELRIDADDVQAKHGATVGQLNEEQLFYLVSRGIPEATARAMLTRGFVEEIGLNLPARLREVFFREVSVDVL